MSVKAGDGFELAQRQDAWSVDLPGPPRLVSIGQPDMLAAMMGKIHVILCQWFLNKRRNTHN